MTSPRPLSLLETGIAEMNIRQRAGLALHLVIFDCAAASRSFVALWGRYSGHVLRGKPLL
jgi:hypothetical protein